MTTTIFWSWQSDLPARETRGLIREALTAAIAEVAAEMDEAARPEIDHDTRGVAGSPDIVATILSKIEKAAVFVADVTPITISDSGKHVANPNVLIELGYAKRALGTERVILVWNTAFTGARPEDLPFDMRHRRGPISFDLPEGASSPALAAAREQLKGRLTQALKACLSTLPPQEPVEIAWQPHLDTTPSIWIEGTDALPVNRGYDGSTRIGVESLPRAYARLVPASWSPVANASIILEGNTTHPTPLGRYSGLNWGSTRGGFLAYRSNSAIEEKGVTPTATRWFRSNGELWGVAACFFSEPETGRIFANHYAAAQWLSWLKHNLGVCAVLGGSGPYHLKMGLDGVLGTSWPRSAYSRSHCIEAVESAVEYETIIFKADDDEELVAAVKGVFDQAMLAYGIDPSSSAEFQAILRQAR